MSSLSRDGKLATITRLLLGAFLVVSVGLRFIFPEQVVAASSFPPHAQAFLDALAETGYLQNLFRITELVVGISLLVKRYVPLVLILFAPINLNIAAFHLFLDPRPARLMIVFFLGAIHLYLAWLYRAYFLPLLQAQDKPIKIQKNEY
jgi:hypothetical protein